MIFILKKHVVDMIPEGNHNFEKTVLPQLIAEIESLLVERGEI